MNDNNKHDYSEQLLMNVKTIINAEIKQFN